MERYPHQAIRLAMMEGPTTPEDKKAQGLFGPHFTALWPREFLATYKGMKQRDANALEKRLVLKELEPEEAARLARHDLSEMNSIAQDPEILPPDEGDDPQVSVGSER